MNLIIFTLDEVNAGFIKYDDDRYRHIKNILKTEVGGHFKAGIINTSSGSARLLNINDDGLHFDYTVHTPAEKPYAVNLVLGMARPLVMRRLLRDCTAIGVQSIMLYTPANGEKGYAQSSLWQDNNYQNALLDGLALAGAVTMPKVQHFGTLAQALSSVKESIVVAMDSRSPHKLNDKGPIASPVSLVIGNERGFTDGDFITLQHYNASIYNMGSRIVRTETATVMALALLLNRWSFI
jgi:RsmE family RNA methyltransferase